MPPFRTRPASNADGSATPIDGRQVVSTLPTLTQRADRTGRQCPR